MILLFAGFIFLLNRPQPGVIKIINRIILTFYVHWKTSEKALKRD